VFEGSLVIELHFYREELGHDEKLACRTVCVRWNWWILLRPTCPVQ
jgi:hypothetical protein